MVGKIRWVVISPKIGAVWYAGYTGGAKVFEIRPSLDRGEDHKITCMLPGFKSNYDNSGTVEEMQAVVDQIFDRWLDYANLIVADDGSVLHI